MKYAALLLIFISFVSCNAPRENPLDPYSDKGNLTTIEGTVQNFSPPFMGISDVSVFWTPENILVKTNNEGFFKIENIKPEAGLIIFSKEGYKPDTVEVEWYSNEIISKSINLNKNPVLDSTKFFSTISTAQDSALLSQVSISAKIIDPDNDIDSVYVINEQLGFSKDLEFDILNKSYEAIFSLDDLGTSSLEQIVGLQFNIFVVNAFNEIFNIGQVYLKRVINDGAHIISPANSDTVNSTPTLLWNEFSAGYTFSYEIKIFDDPLGEMGPVFSISGITEETNTLKINNPLENGNYFWVVSTVDEFGNRFQSKTQIFYVE